MNRSTSIYLDGVRFFAAVIVFVGHVSGQRLTGGLFWEFGPLGPEAVDVFFVLSGFVIAYVADKREHHPRHYFVSRAARIYSVALPALVVTFVLDAIGRSVNPALYNLSWHYLWDDRGLQLFQAVIFVNQLWWNNMPPGSAFPYWSLGFEVWYYLIFGMFLFLPGRFRYICAAFLLLVAGPKITALLPIWLLGVLAYRISTSRNLTVPAGFLFWLGSISLWIAYEIYVYYHGRPIGPNWLGRPPVFQDYIIGGLFFFNLLGFAALGGMFERALVFMERPIRWLAGTTLTLYLFHMPLAQFFAAVLPWPSDAWQTRLAVYLGVPLAVAIIAEYTERRKRMWHRAIDQGVETVLSWRIWKRI